MKLVLAEPKYLKESLSIIAELVTEVTFKVNKEALEVVAMDPANVAMVIFKLLSSSFVTYEVEEDKEISLNLTYFKQILKRVGPSDTLTLESEDNKLNIKIVGTVTKTFSIPLLDIEERSQRVPELNFPTSVEMDASLFNSSVEDAGIVAESLALGIDKDLFIVSAEGDLSKAKIELKSDDINKVDNPEDLTVKAKFSIEYLKKMIQGSKITNKVTLRFNTNYPLKLEYKVIDKMFLAFILAPRVEND